MPRRDRWSRFGSLPRWARVRVASRPLRRARKGRRNARRLRSG
jgi:hypothetical protein